MGFYERTKSFQLYMLYLLSYMIHTQRVLQKVKKCWFTQFWRFCRLLISILGFFFIFEHVLFCQIRFLTFIRVFVAHWNLFIIFGQSDQNLIKCRKLFSLGPNIGGQPVRGNNQPSNFAGGRTWLKIRSDTFLGQFEADGEWKYESISLKSVSDREDDEWGLWPRYIFSQKKYISLKMRWWVGFLT